MNLIEATNYFLSEEDIQEEVGSTVMCRGVGIRYFVNPTIPELESIRAHDKHGDIRIGIENGKIIAWKASEMLHDEMEKADMRKFNFRSTIMKNEDIPKLLDALQDLAKDLRLCTTMKDDAILRKHAYRND